MAYVTPLYGVKLASLSLSYGIMEHEAYRICMAINEVLKTSYAKISLKMVFKKVSLVNVLQAFKAPASLF